MKKLLLVLVFISNIFALDIKLDGVNKNINHTYINGQYKIFFNTFFKDDSDLMIKFITVDPVKIKEFELKYSLELSQVLISGYYIYEFTGMSVIDKIDEILFDDDNIYTVKPVWNKKAQTR